MAATRVNKRSALALGLLFAVPGLAGSFTPLGDYGGLTFTSAYAVSSDGAVVVGVGLYNQAYRWTAATGPQPLPGPDTGNYWVARAISGNGSLVVGNGRSEPSFSQTEIYVWDASTGTTTSLGDLPGGTSRGLGTAVSANGSVIAGTGSSASGTEAFRWTSATGLVGLGDLPGGSFNSQATGISDDGAVIIGVGTRENPDPPQFVSRQEAFRWTEGSGLESLGDLEGGPIHSVAWDTNADGSVIVGESFAANGIRAFRWTATEGMVAIPGLAGYSSDRASAVSGNGSLIAGNSGRHIADTSQTEFDAFIWTAELGAQRLLDVLVAQGATGLEGWRLTSVIDISPDGQWLVGDAIDPTGNTQAFRAQLSPVPGPATGLLTLTGLASLGVFSKRRRAKDNTAG